MSKLLDLEGRTEEAFTAVTNAGRLAPPRDQLDPDADRAWRMELGQRAASARDDREERARGYGGGGMY